MHNNITALRHPTVMTKVRRAVWMAKLIAARKAKQNESFPRGVQYVENRKGFYFMRIDWVHGVGLTAYGQESRNITKIVNAALYEAKRGI